MKDFQRACVPPVSYTHLDVYKRQALIYFIPLRLAPAWIVILILAREFLVTSLRLIASGKGIVIAADKWGKYKTATTMVWICYALLMTNFIDTMSIGMQSVCTGKMCIRDRTLSVHKQAEPARCSRCRLSASEKASLSRRSLVSDCARCSKN